jgi:nucleoside recognition membrane protein YjiH
MSRHHRLHIWALLSVIRGMARFICEDHVVQVLWKQSLQDSRIFCSAVTCATVVLWFFETILLNVRRSISFWQCWFSRTVPRRWRCLTMILVCRPLSIHLMMWQAVFATDTQVKRTPAVCPVWKIGQVSTFSESFALTVAQHNLYCTDASTTDCK